MTTSPISRSDRFGDIRPRRYRGGGGFSDVYEGVTTSGKRVALKVFRFQDSQNEREIEKLNRERKVLARINSRGVAKYYDSNFDNDPPWIASEYVDGPTLKEAITSKGLMNAQSTELLIHQISSALTEIHKENVAHRDLSPNNVILGPDGPVIIDFGSSRLTDSSKGLVSILTSGTPGYLSPEAQTGLDASTPSDIFAIAKVAEFALTGESDSPQSEKLNQLSPSLARMLYQALEIDPSRRPTAQEIMDACQPNYESLKEISASSYPEVELKKIPIRFRLRTVSIIAIAAAALGLLTVQFFREKPITTESLMEYISKQVPADSITKYKTVTRTGGAIRKFDLPENFIQERVRLSDSPNPIYVDIDAIYIATNSFPRDTVLHVVSSVHEDSDFIFDEISQERELPFYDDRWSSISSYISRERAFRQENYLPQRCTFETPKFLMLDKIKRSLSAVIVTKNCSSEETIDNHIVAVLYFPEKNLMVTVTGFYDPTEIDMNRFIQSIEVTAASVLVKKNDVKNDLLSLSQYKHETAKILYGDNTNDGFFYARTPILLSRGEAFEVKFSETQEDNYSMWGFIVSDEVKNSLIPMGRVWTFEDSGSRVFSNTKFDELILIIELDSLSETRPLIETKFAKANSRNHVFDSSMTNLDIGRHDIHKSFSYIFEKEYFSLPIDPEYENTFATKDVTVGGINIKIPSIWSEKTIPTSSKTKNTNFIYAIFSSGSDYFSALEDDLPHISITDEYLAETQLRKDGWSWIESDAFNCASSNHFSFDSEFFHVEWTVLLQCEISDAFKLRGSEGKSEQAAPIFRILVTDPLASVSTDESPSPRLRINFVPETLDDLDYLKEMILSLKPSK